MSNETTATAMSLTEQIDFMLTACSDYGVAMVAENATELLSEVHDPDVAAQQLEELARLIRRNGEAAEGKAA